MQKREGRSFAPPPSPPSRPGPGRTGRRGWKRPDVPRPMAPARVPLPSPDPMVAEIEEPEEIGTVDVFGLLSVEARRDVLAESVASNTGRGL